MIVVIHSKMGGKHEDELKRDVAMKLQMEWTRFESSVDDHDNHFGDLKSK